jgi:hypothetical protein
VVLPPQRRRRPPRLLLQAAQGQGRLLAPRGVTAFAPDAAGLAPRRVEGPGGWRPDCGVRPREPSSPADRPLDGEAASHLRDARGRGPRRIGAITVAAGPLPAGVCGHPARRAIDLRTGQNDDATLWAFTMLPVGPLVSGNLLPLVLLVREVLSCLEILPVPLQIRAVNAERSDPPTPRSREHARAVQRREQERAARKRERSLRRRERRERRSEEFRLREQ